MSILRPKSLTKTLLTKRKRHGPSEEVLADMRKKATPRNRKGLSDEVRSMQQNFMGVPNRRDTARAVRAGTAGQPRPRTPTMSTMPVRETPMAKLPARVSRPAPKPPAVEVRPMPKPNPRPTRPIAKPPAVEVRPMAKPNPRRRRRPGMV